MLNLLNLIINSIIYKKKQEKNAAAQGEHQRLRTFFGTSTFSSKIE